MKPKLALFDFDGTITSTDTLWAFLKFLSGPSFYLKAATTLPFLIGLKAGLVPADVAKQKVLWKFFKGYTIEELSVAAKVFATTRLQNLIRPKALERIKEFKAEGIQVTVVTASLELWVKPWCDLHQLDCIGTRMIFENGLFTGKYELPNCNGPEKVLRIKAIMNPNDYYIIGFGDSKGDLPMLELAQEKHFKPFRV